MARTTSRGGAGGCNEPGGIELMVPELCFAAPRGPAHEWFSPSGAPSVRGLAVDDTQPQVFLECVEIAIAVQE